MEDSSAPGNSRQQLALRLAGAALLVATGAIHLDLYLTGYRHIPKIGPASCSRSSPHSRSPPPCC